MSFRNALPLRQYRLSRSTNAKQAVFILQSALHTVETKDTLLLALCVRVNTCIGNTISTASTTIGGGHAILVPL